MERESHYDDSPAFFFLSCSYRISLANLDPSINQSIDYDEPSQQEPPRTGRTRRREASLYFHSFTATTLASFSSSRLRQGKNLKRMYGMVLVDVKREGDENLFIEALIYFWCNFVSYMSLSLLFVLLQLYSPHLCPYLFGRLP